MIVFIIFTVVTLSRILMSFCYYDFSPIFKIDLWKIMCDILNIPIARIMYINIIYTKRNQDIDMFTEIQHNCRNAQLYHNNMSCDLFYDLESINLLFHYWNENMYFRIYNNFASKAKFTISFVFSCTTLLLL